METADRIELMDSFISSFEINEDIPVCRSTDCFNDLKAAVVVGIAAFSWNDDSYEGFLCDRDETEFEVNFDEEDSEPRLLL